MLDLVDLRSEGGNAVSVIAPTATDIGLAPSHDANPMGTAVS